MTQIGMVLDIAAISAMIDAAKELRDEGRCGFVDTSIPTPELSAYMKS